jgi:hypothetical protein
VSFNLRRDAAPQATSQQRFEQWPVIVFQSQARCRSTSHLSLAPVCLYHGWVSISGEMPLHKPPKDLSWKWKLLYSFQSQARCRSTSHVKHHFMYSYLLTVSISGEMPLHKPLLSHTLPVALHSCFNLRRDAAPQATAGGSRRSRTGAIG